MFASTFIMVFNILSIGTYAPVMYEEEIPAESCEAIIDCVLEMYTNGITEADMDQIYVDRFTLNLIYSTIIGTIIGELTASLMIDGYASLKEEDSIRDEDKTTLCYICAMSKPDVLFVLSRWKK